MLSPTFLRSTDDDSGDFLNNTLDPIEDDPGGFIADPEIAVTARQEGKTTLEKVLEDGVNVVDKVTKAPEWLESQAEGVNDQLISWAEKIKGAVDQAAGTAEDNLTENKITSFFTRAGRWIQDNKTAALIGGAVIAIFILRR